jgi:gliding motility-associated-like protein
MEEKDFIKDLFQEKLSNFETPVRPEVWSSISTSIGSTSAATGLSFITKFIIGTSLTAAISTGIWFAVSNSENESQTNKELIKKDKESVLELKEEAKVQKTTKPQFSDVENKMSVDESILLPPPIPNVYTTNIVLQENQNSNNSTHKFQEQIIEEKQELTPAITPKIDSNSESKTENTTTNLNTGAKQVPTQSDIKISLPNIFTPNGDGNNDLFAIPKVDLSDFSLVILDEKGKTIFTTTDTEFSWDGTMMNGEKAPVGSYVYFITAKDLNGKSYTKYSDLSIRY